MILTFAIAKVSFRVILPLDSASYEFFSAGVMQVIVWVSMLTAVTFANELLVSYPGNSQTAFGFCVFTAGKFTREIVMTVPPLSGPTLG
jgi:hypothetical protein